MKNKKLRIVFRVDGNKKIGMGHVMRCLALADELKERIGCKIFFVMKNSADSEKEVLKCGYDITANFPKSFLDIAIVSVPDIGNKYLSTIKKQVKLLVVIDDSAKTQYCADIVVKCSCVPELSRFDRKAKGKFLIGLDYVILNKEFQIINLRKKIINPKAKSVLITMGGSDINNLTPKIMEALKKISDIKKTVVVGPAFKNKLKPNKEYDSKYGVSNMASLMFSSDLAIVGGGITLYEVACVGTPGIVLCQTDYQKMEAECFEKAGAILNLGFGKNLGEEKIAASVKVLLKDKEMRKKMSNIGKKIIDGKGAKRVVDKILDKIRKYE
ncbi:MAG: glycosyltransferase [Candidatus Pacebacteria bacterium]|nr:glycosyltransferase [Candidatus Paceibacterota bacterium]